LIIPSVSVAVTSALTGPLIILVIFSNTEKKSSPDFATREGFVVIPSISPVSLRSFMTSTSAVSKKKVHTILIYIYYYTYNMKNK
jgi:hypothetical protein